MPIDRLYNAYVRLNDILKGVRIADGYEAEAEGAVAVLWRMLKSLEWAGTTAVPGFMTARKCRVCGTVEESRNQKHAPDCELDAALRRFEVEANADATETEATR